jgi:hypothetical protein
MYNARGGVGSPPCGLLFGRLRGPCPSTCSFHCYSFAPSSCSAWLVLLILLPMVARCSTPLASLTSGRHVCSRPRRRCERRCDAPGVGVNLVPKGAPTPQYSSPPKGPRTKEPLRRTTPSSITANSTTTATTKQKLEKTTTAYYFGVLHHLMLSLISYSGPPIYRDGGTWRFSPKPLVVIFFRAPGGRGIYRKLLEPTQRPTNPYMGWATPPTPGF